MASDYDTRLMPSKESHKRRILQNLQERRILAQSVFPRPGPGPRETARMPSRSYDHPVPGHGGQRPSSMPPQTQSQRSMHTFRQSPRHGGLPSSDSLQGLPLDPRHSAAPVASHPPPSSRPQRVRHPSPQQTSQRTHLRMQQQAALQYAHSVSNAYFITQDSAFGNLILPVIPRFDQAPGPP